MAHPLGVPPTGVMPAAAGAGGPPGPGIPVIPAIPPVAVRAPRCYRELFSDEANSPPRDRLAEYMQGYRFDGGPTTATLRDQTVNLSDRQPMAFLCMVAGIGGAYEVHTVHRLMRYIDIPGEPASGFHDHMLGLLGDILPHQYPAVDIPGTIFHLVATPVRVPTTAGMAVLAPTWDKGEGPLGPYTEGDPETEVVRPRHVQIVPGYYTALLIHRRGVSPKVAYQELHGAMAARGELESSAKTFCRG